MYSIGTRSATDYTKHSSEMRMIITYIRNEKKEKATCVRFHVSKERTNSIHSIPLTALAKYLKYFYLLENTSAGLFHR